MDFDEQAVRALQREIIEGWNARDAAAMTRSWSTGAAMVGYDGTQKQGRDAAREAMAAVFAHHEVARYVCLVREVRPLAPGVALLQAHAGMVPPGKDTVMPQRHAVQTLVAVLRDGRWQTEVFQNTPARWDGREDDVRALTRELQAAFDAGRA